jgi:hypothetical protein
MMRQFFKEHPESTFPIMSMIEEDPNKDKSIREAAEEIIRIFHIK